MEKEAQNNTNNDTVEKITRIYELGYLVVPTVSEDKLPSEVSLVKDAIIENEGVVISEETPKTKPLAYEMSKTISNKIAKFNTAYFGWFKFETSPNQIRKIEKKLDNNINILRTLIIRTVKEDTLVKSPQVKRKPLRKPKMESEGGGNGESKSEISKEEMDKTIEELVVE